LHVYDRVRFPISFRVSEKVVLSVIARFFATTSKVGNSVLPLALLAYSISQVLQSLPFVALLVAVVSSVFQVSSTKKLVVS
jgi:hypothetical protein